MDLARLLLVLKEAGVCRTGHFVGVSGKHLDMFVNFEDMFKPENEDHLDFIVGQLVELIGENTILWPTYITGPAEGGNLLCERLAPDLSERLGYQVKVALTERISGAENFTFKSRIDLKGETVLVLDGVSASGQSVLNVSERVRAFRGEVLGVVVAVDREGLTSDKLGVPLYRFLIALQTKSYDVPIEGCQACPLCMSNVPINVEPGLGHGAEYVAKHGQPRES